MPVVPDSERVDGALLVGPDGAPVARFLRGTRDGRPLADLLELAPDVPPERAVPQLMGELRGWRVAPPEPLGQLLVAAGATPRRNAHVMSRDVARDPPDPAWLEAVPTAALRLTPLDRPAAALAAAHRAAYPPDHPDFALIPDPARPEDELADIIAGRVLGPLLPASGLAIDASGSVVGAVLVTRAPGEAPFGGPWITDVFRDPRASGAGGALLRRALAITARDGLPALSLAVSHANPARRLYDRLGFRDVLHTLSVDL